MLHMRVDNTQLLESKRKYVLVGFSMERSKILMCCLFALTTHAGLTHADGVGPEAGKTAKYRQSHPRQEITGQRG